MTPHEKHYRILTIRERIHQLAGELTVIAEELKNDSALRGTDSAIHELLSAERALAPVATLEHPSEILRESLRVVRDRKNCEEVSRG